MTKKSIRLLELFSGIGSQTTALQNLGIEHTSVCCEIDGQAHTAYEAMHGPTENLGDITKVERLPPCDLLTYSYPCIRGDQKVRTQRGLVPIKDVKVGDEVLTHKGRYMPVTGHAMTGVHRTVRMVTETWDLVCTPDHRILTKRGYRGGMDRETFEALPTEWVRADELESGGPDQIAVRPYADSNIVEWWGVVRIDDCDEAVEVYDISVEEDESFVVEGFVVHNCQAVSVAGTRAGMEEGSGTTSSLVWEVGRLLTVAKEHGELPEYLLMENVKGVLHNPNKTVFDKWCRHLTSLGYTQSYAVLNAKDFGVPQNRERIFMVSTLNHGALMFPSRTGRKVVLRDVMESDVDESYFLTEERIASYERHRRNQEEAGRGFGWNPAVPEGVASTVVTSPSSSSTSTVVVSGGKDWRERADGIVVSGHLNLPGWFESAQRVYDPRGVAPTIPTGAGGGHIPRLDVSDGPVGAEQVRIRYLTPRECWRLQGFDDERIDRAFKVIEHDSPRYRMAGNSIAVPCLEAIFRSMFIDKRFVKGGRLDEW